MIRILLITIALFINIGFCAINAQNPIYKGLNKYGQRDFHIYKENKNLYLLATEVVKPGNPKRGIVMYRSKSFNEWKEYATLIDRDTIAENKWYRDEWSAPELHHIGNEYYLTFSCRNNTTHPYSTMGIGIARSKTLTGPFEIITSQPLTLGNRFTLIQAPDNKVYGYWDRDGFIYGAEIDIDNARIIGKEQSIARPYEFRKDDKFLDSPCVIYDKGTYYMTYCVFKGGYYAAFLTSSSPLSSWKSSSDNIIFYRSEDQASTVLRNNYEKGKTYAPPCEIIGNIQLLETSKDEWKMIYHSEDKYSEPFLCVDKAQIVNKKIISHPTLK